MEIDNQEFEPFGKKEADLIRLCGQYLANHADEIAYKGGIVAENGVTIQVNIGDGLGFPTITVSHEVIVTNE
ncbi:MAG: hypothetical protein LKE64_12085 [Solobacterium sp.]|nr:hypothetical protein [Solobacterium sp.]MCH4047996.1 hypothetical protein [Solobacterium sp.]MCH4075418.1 hypothetical protein [Solobacterium sp.]MCI1313732.1 hypothetical protein [Solobacterium sp.]MCI1407129.1 hypothetical protein [Solobacterium sp.]